MALLKVNSINSHYGQVQALWDVSLEVEDGELVVVLGANGAGKTTLVKTIVGLIEPSSGMIKFAGRRIEGRDPHRINALGMAYGPEGGGLFRDMTVRENLEMGAFNRFAWERRRQTLERVLRRFPRLEERERTLARNLSGGERQMLVIGRVMMSLPTLCVFDEPSIGLSPRAVDEAFDAIRQLHHEGITVLLIEQNVRQSLELADRAYVLENGRVVMEGSRDTLLNEEMVKKAYLGL